MKSRIFLLMAAVFLVTLSLPRQAAAQFELSLGFNFHRTDYGQDIGYSWNRRWGTSFGYYFGDRSEVEFGYTEVVERTKIHGLEDTTFHDRIYSLNVVQSLAPRDFPVQPYVKIGIGQLDREATGEYTGGGAPPKLVLSVTGIIGAGARIYIAKGFSIRLEATSYLAGGNISKFKENAALSFGISSTF